MIEGKLKGVQVNTEGSNVAQVTKTMVFYSILRAYIRQNMALVKFQNFGLIG